MSTHQAYDRVLAALCIYREARGETTEGRRAILHVILNRQKDKRWPRVLSEVVLQPAQFSCFNTNDPNATVLPRWDNPIWRECCELVDNPGEDPTNGANHYHTHAVRPIWSRGKEPVAVIGGHRFFKL